MNWHECVEIATPLIVKIETPNGHGTGFLCVYNHNDAAYGIATAAHVVEHAHKWQQPIRVTSVHTNESYFVQHSERAIFIDYERDSAVIMLFSPELTFVNEPLPLFAKDLSLPIGVEVGWLGFPSLANSTLCFFSGKVSAKRDGYLIDGVAINGVSGGPVLVFTKSGIQIIGAITAYIPNGAGMGALPGLSVASDVSHLHDTVAIIKSLEEAKQRSDEMERTPKLDDGGVSAKQESADTSETTG